jgi:hypothetical protein
MRLTSKFIVSAELRVSAKVGKMVGSGKAGKPLER